MSAATLMPRLLEAVETPPPRPLALVGHTGAGKTRLLRAVAARGESRAVRAPVRDLVGQMTRAIRDVRYRAYRERFAADPRPWFLEHVEDLRGMARTREEVRRLLEERAARGHCSVLTMTRGEQDEEIVEWLAAWTELHAFD